MGRRFRALKSNSTASSGFKDIMKEQTTHNQQALKDASDDKLIKDLWKEIRTLPKDCRKVVILFCFDSCTPEEISQMLRIPINTVNQQLQLAQKRMSIDLYSAVE